MVQNIFPLLTYKVQSVFIFITQGAHEDPLKSYFHNKAKYSININPKP